MTDFRYFEDLRPGEQHTTAPVEVTKTEIIEFAGKYDPQPMHLEGENLLASGWHTAALTMRLFVTSDWCRPPPGALGLGVKSLQWLRPVRAGDWLYSKIELLDLRLSRSRPRHGIASYRFLTFNQNDELVQSMESGMLLPCRQA